jgi:hypothetical protein
MVEAKVLNKGELETLGEFVRGRRRASMQQDKKKGT